MLPQASKCYRLALEAAQRRGVVRAGEERARLNQDEITEISTANRDALESALDRTPFVPPDDFWPDTGVITREEAAIMHRAARNGLNIDFIPLNARIRSPHTNGAA